MQGSQAGPRRQESCSDASAQHSIRSRAAKKAITKRKRHPKGSRLGGRLRNPAKRKKTRKLSKVSKVRKARKGKQAAGTGLVKRVKSLETRVGGLSRKVSQHEVLIRSHGRSIPGKFPGLIGAGARPKIRSKLRIVKGPSGMITAARDRALADRYSNPSYY